MISCLFVVGFPKINKKDLGGGGPSSAKTQAMVFIKLCFIRAEIITVLIYKFIILEIMSYSQRKKINKLNGLLVYNKAVN